MNCRFCGTIVSNPPSDCPKCGRPVSQSDYTRAADQIVAANVVYHERPRSRRSPFLLMLGTIGIAVLLTAGLVWYSRHAQMQPAQQVVQVPQPTFTPERVTDGKTTAVVTEPPSRSGPTAIAAPGDEPAETAVYKGPNIDELVSKAKAAMARGDLTEPSQDNALKWAREARVYGSGEGASVENQIYAELLNSVEDSRKATDYATALQKLDQMILLFPNRNSLPTLRAAIRKEQRGN